MDVVVVTPLLVCVVELEGIEVQLSFLDVLVPLVVDVVLDVDAGVGDVVELV